MVVSSVINFHTAMRQGVVELLQEYKAQAGINLQIYPGREYDLRPPSVFRDFQNEDSLITTQSTRQRNIHSAWIVLWSLFDSGSAVIQRDTFVDGFSAYVLNNFHKVGGATDLYIGTVTDLPEYEVTWGPENQRVTYYATRITVEGFASG